MIHQIQIYKKIKAQSSQQAMEKIREKYPFARLITYKFDKNFQYERPKDYSNRTMSVAVIKDFRKIKEEL